MYPDIYIIPLDNNKNIVYLPKHSCAFTINSEGTKYVQKLIDGNPIPPKALPIKERLDSIYNSVNSLKSQNDSDIIRECNTVSIVLHQMCNLACTYCFAKNTRTKNYIPQEDLIFILDKEINKNNKKNVTFIGGGEPTLMWNLLLFGIDYIRKQCPEATKISIVTNGTLLTDEKLHFLKKNRVSLVISFDILKDVQNTQRPFQSLYNKSSFDVVACLIDKLSKLNIPFVIRSTIVEDTVTRMPEMIEFVHQRFPFVKTVHLEHVSSPDLSPVYYHNFVVFFFRARSLAEKYGIFLTDSISNSFTHNKSYGFCLGDNCYSPLQDNSILLSRCHRVSSFPENGSKNKFIIGRYKNKELIESFSIEKDILPIECSHCFARLQCAGGCMAERELLPDRLLKEKCNMIRYAYKILLAERLGIRMEI